MVRRLRVKSRRPYRKNKVMRVSRSIKRQPSSRNLSLRIFETKKKETRWGETSISSLAGWFTNAGSMILSQGDTYSTIEGHIIRGKGISFQGWFKNNASTTMIVRYGIMLVKNGNSDYSTFNGGSDALEGDSGDQSITTADSVARVTQRFNADKYKVVKQYFVKLGSNGANDGSDVKQWKFWVPINGYAYRYNGSNTLPTKNVYAFYACVCLANNDEVLGENVEVSGTSTFYYIDP